MNADVAKLLERIVTRLESLEGAVRSLEGKISQVGTPYPQPWPQPNYTGPFPQPGYIPPNPAWPPAPYCTTAINNDITADSHPGEIT